MTETHLTEKEQIIAEALETEDGRARLAWQAAMPIRRFQPATPNPQKRTKAPDVKEAIDTTVERYGFDPADLEVATFTSCFVIMHSPTNKIFRVERAPLMDIGPRPVITKSDVMACRNDIVDRVQQKAREAIQKVEDQDVLDGMRDDFVLDGDNAPEGLC